MIFEQKMQTVQIGSRKIPVKFNIRVMEQLQEQYGTLNAYEYKLKGLKPHKLTADEIDAQSKAIDAGKPIEKIPEFDRIEPSVKAVSDGMILMIHAGLRISGKEDILDDMTDEQILSAIRMTYPEQRDIVITEFGKCFKIDEKK